MFRAAAAVVLVVLPLLAACGELPHPFKPDAAAPPSALIELRMDVRVYPVAGVPADAAEWLSRAIVDAFGAEGVTAARSDDVDARFVLDGVYQSDAAGGGGTVEWTLRHGDGSVARSLPLAVALGPADWRPEAAPRIRAVAAATAQALLPSVQNDEAAPAKPARIGVFVDGVSGAPGDGDTALARAIARALEAEGVPLAESREAAEYVLSGVIAVAPPNEGAQAITLLWKVSRPNGDAVGEARQVNAVPAGSLDRAWGMVAHLAAQAAAPGVVEVLGRDAAAPAGRGIDLPPEPTLPPPPGLPR